MWQLLIMMAGDSALVAAFSAAHPGVFEHHVQLELAVFGVSMYIAGGA